MFQGEAVDESKYRQRGRHENNKFNETPERDESRKKGDCYTPESLASEYCRLLRSTAE